MNIVRANNGLVVNLFSFDYQNVTHYESIVMLEAEYNLLSDDQINAIKKEKIDAWIFMAKYRSTPEQLNG